MRQQKTISLLLELGETADALNAARMIAEEMSINHLASEQDPFSALRGIVATLNMSIARLGLLRQAVAGNVNPQLMLTTWNRGSDVEDAGSRDISIPTWSDEQRAEKAKEEIQAMRRRK